MLYDNTKSLEKTLKTFESLNIWTLTVQQKHHLVVVMFQKLTVRYDLGLLIFRIGLHLLECGVEIDQKTLNLIS